jgi:hypothetical protein
MTLKTDRKDARALTQLIRMGSFRVELSIRGILRGFGLNIGVVTPEGFEARVREPVTGQAALEHLTRAMLSARAALKVEYEKLPKSVLAMVREEAVCRGLMTVPGVGPCWRRFASSAQTMRALLLASPMPSVSRVSTRRLRTEHFGQFFIRPRQTIERRFIPDRHRRSVVIFRAC